MKKLLLALVLVLFMATGCEQFQNKQLMDRSDKLEKQVAMLKAGGTGASFYPVSGGFDENTSGNLDNIGSTAASDAAFVVFAENSMWGWGLFPFALDAAGGLTQALPYVVDAKDGGNEDWNWISLYGRKLFGHMHVITDANGCRMLAHVKPSSASFI